MPDTRPATLVRWVAPYTDLDDLYEIGLSCGWQGTWTPAAYLRHLQSSCGFGVVCEHHYKPVGFALWQLFPRRVELTAVAVLPTYRRRGVGKTLLRRAVAHGMGRPARCTAGEGHDWLPVHRWLRACGWRATGVVRDHGGKGVDGYRFEGNP